MATKVGPIKGVRVPVKLPWKGAAQDNDQFVSVKKPVAEYLKLDAASRADLTYKGKIRFKRRDADGNPTGDLLSKVVDKIRRPGFRQRSIRVFFGNRNTGEPKGVIIGTNKRKSFDFPVTKSVLISDIYDEFMTGKWKGLPVIKIVDTSTGQGYPIH